MAPAEHLIYGGLIRIGVVLVQPFLTSNASGQQRVLPAGHGPCHRHRGGRHPPPARVSPLPPASSSALGRLDRPHRDGLLSLVAGVVGLQRRADPAIAPLFAPVALAGDAVLLQYTGEMLQLHQPMPDQLSAAFAYRYSGLRPLIHAGGRWFLLPAGWTPDNGATVIVLPDSVNNIRVDLSR